MTKAQRKSPFGSLRQNETCAATERAFRPGERIVACLADDPERDELRRFDYTTDAWQGGARPPSPLSVVATWKTTAKQGDAKPTPDLDDEGMLDLLEQLEGVTEPRRVAFRYLLALTLIRKRVLIYEGGRPSDQRHGVTGEILVRVKGTPPPPEGPQPMAILDPGLDEDELVGPAQELATMLNLMPSS